MHRSPSSLRPSVSYESRALLRSWFPTDTNVTSPGVPLVSFTDPPTDLHNTTCFTCPQLARPSATKNKPTSTLKSTRIDPYSPHFSHGAPSGSSFLCTVRNSARPHPYHTACLTQHAGNPKPDFPTFDFGRSNLVP